MRHDITVFLFGGTYRLTAPLVLAPQDSGTNGYEVVYRGVPGQSPIVSGGMRIVRWTVHDRSKNIWQAPVPAGFDTRQLYVNGVRATRAAGQPPVTLTPTPGGYTASSSAMSRWRNPGDLEFVYVGATGAWTEDRCGVASIVGTKIRMREPCWDNTTNRNPRIEPTMNPSTLPTYIENAYELLSKPGDWYLDRRAARLYYIPKPGQDPRTARVIAPVLQTLVQGVGTLERPVHNIEFLGVSFEYAGWLGPSSGNGFSELQANFTFTGAGAGRMEGGCSYGGTCPFGAMTKTPANVTFHAAHAIAFVRDIFAHLGGAGLAFAYGSQENRIVGNVFTDISANAIQIGDTTDAEPSDVGADSREINARNTVLDNYIHDTPVEYHGGVGIWEGYTQDTLIAHNQIDQTPYSGISSGWGWGEDSSVDTNVARDNRIDANLVFDTVRDLSDGGGIYVNGVQGTSTRDGTELVGNVVHDAAHGVHAGYALYTDASEHVTMKRNVLYSNLNDWGGCRISQFFGDFVFHGNWWQGRGPGFGCGPPIEPAEVSANTIISRAQDAPNKVVAAAGLEPAYRDLLGEPVPW